MITKTKNLILGCGATAMYLAKRLNDFENTLIVSQNIGGLLQQQLAVTESGTYRFDQGGHVYTANDARTETLMIKARANQFDRTNMVFYLKEGKEFIEFPVQNNIEIHPLKDMLLEFSLREWAINRFGYAFYNDFFEPFNERCWTMSPSDMSFNWINDRVSVTKDKGWGPNATFYYVPGDNLIEIMKHDIGGVKIIKGIAKYLNFKEKTVSYTDNKTGEIYFINYERLFDTTTKQIDYVNQCLYFGVGLKGFLNFKPFYWLYPDVKSPIHRITWINRYYKHMAPEGHDSLLIEVPFRSEFKRKYGSTFNLRYSKLSETAMLSDMLKAAGIPINQKDIEVVSSFMSYAYPIPHLKVRRKVEITKHIGLKNNVYYAGRWGSHGYFNLQHLWQDVDSVIEQLESEEPLSKYTKSNFYYKDR